MPLSPPILVSQDAEHLRLLSIFHYVGAGLACLALAFLAVHGLFMITVFSRVEPAEAMPLPPLLFFGVFYAVVGLFHLASVVLNLLAARYLRQCRRRTFVMVVAGLNCLHMPLGTALGVFTLVVLSRESVVRAFAGGHAGSQDLAAPPPEPR